MVGLRFKNGFFFVIYFWIKVLVVLMVKVYFKFNLLYKEYENMDVEFFLLLFLNRIGIVVVCLYIKNDLKNLFLFFFYILGKRLEFGGM